MIKIRCFNTVRWVVFLLCLVSSQRSVQAQTLSQIQQTTQIPTVPQAPQIPATLPTKKKPLNLPQYQATEIPKQRYSPARARVTKFIFQGNTVFSQRQLEAVVAAYMGREITFAQLLQARSAITKYYAERGYITSGALVPLKGNQLIRQADGGLVVTIVIVEGKLEKINLSGSDRLHNYVHSRLKAATSPVLNTNHLLEALRLLQTDPLIEAISANLDAGSKVGGTILNVRVKAQQAFRVEAALDNERSPTIGTSQQRIQMSHANLLGLGDRLSLGYRHTKGSDAIETSYLVPINSHNGTIELGYTNISSDIVERPFNQLDIISDARAIELTFRQPIVRQATAKATKEFALGLSAARLESESYLLGTPFPLSRGADERGRTKISAIRFFQEWNKRSGTEVFLARSQFSLGIGTFDATINNSDPDSRFLAWRGQTAWLRRLGETTLVLRADLQLADRPLVPLEQFGLGGATTVRGYRQDALVSDNGFLASAELRISVWKGEAGELQVIPFVDVGTTWNNNGADDNLTEPETGTLLSVGLGLQYQLSDRFSARLDWGIPLVPINTNSSSDSWQEEGLHFGVRYQLF